MTSYILPYTIDNKKVSKKEIVEYIISYFENKGKRLSNVKRANMEQLNDIVVKYNLPLDNLIASVKEQRLQNIRDKEEKKKRKEEEKRREEQDEIERNEEYNRMIEIINSYHQKFVEIVKLKHNFVKHIQYLQHEKENEIKRLKEDEEIPKKIAEFKRDLTNNVYYDYDKRSYVINGMNWVFGENISSMTLEHYLCCHQYDDYVLLRQHAFNKEFININNHFINKKKRVKMRFVIKK